MTKKIQNEQLVPEVILNMINSYQKASEKTNEKYAMFQRLDAIRQAIDVVLK